MKVLRRRVSGVGVDATGKLPQVLRAADRPAAGMRTGVERHFVLVAEELKERGVETGVVVAVVATGKNSPQATFVMTFVALPITFPAAAQVAARVAAGDPIAGVEEVGERCATCERNGRTGQEQQGHHATPRWSNRNSRHDRSLSDIGCRR